jgi:choice-of-anchor A domain-containing protein
MAKPIVKTGSLVASVSTLLSLANTAHAASLGVANDFNVFVFGDVKQNNTDAEGRVAIGGNAILTDYYAGMNLPNTATPADALMVGQRLSFDRGQVKGNAVYGTTATTNQVTLLNNGSLSQRDSSEFFNQAKSYLTDLSTSLSGLPAIAATANFGKISLSGTNSSFNLFTISGDDLSTANTLDINAPNSSTVVINVSGQSAKLQNMGFLLNNTARQNILYNFYEATQITASGVGIEGSVLDFNNGQLNGTLVAESLEGTGQMNVVYFKGDVPERKKVPEPALAAGLIGLAMIVGWRRRSLPSQR